MNVHVDDTRGMWSVGGDFGPLSEEGEAKQQEEEEEEDKDATTTTTTEEDLARLTVPMLREMLRARGGRLGGKKAELIDRLRSEMDVYDAGAEEEEDNNVVVQEEDEEEEEENGEGEEAVLNLRSLTVPALKDMLRSKGMKVGGRKSDLVERLRLTA